MNSSEKHKTIDYISVNRIPNKHANSVQILDFVSSLSKYSRVRMCAPFQKGFLGVSQVSIHRLSSQKIVKYIGILLFLIMGIFRSSDGLYTRNLNVGIASSLLFRNHSIVELHHSPSRFQYILIKLAYQFSSRLEIVAISPLLQSEINSRCAITAHCVPLSTNGWEDDPAEIGSERYDFGYFGSDAIGKGVSDVVKLAEKLRDCSFLVVGPEPKNWEDRPENVEMLGRVPHIELGCLMDKCAVLLAPYQNEIFGADGKKEISQSISPLKVFEYLSRARPVIASRIKSIEVQLGQNAPLVFIEPGDEVELRIAALELLRDGERRKQLSHSGYRLWKNRFTSDARARTIVGLFG